MACEAPDQVPRVATDGTQRQGVGQEGEVFGRRMSAGDDDSLRLPVGKELRLEQLPARGVGLPKLLRSPPAEERRIPTDRISGHLDARIEALAAHVPTSQHAPQKIPHRQDAEESSLNPRSLHVGLINLIHFIKVLLLKQERQLAALM